MQKLKKQRNATREFSVGRGEGNEGVHDSAPSELQLLEYAQFSSSIILRQESVKEFDNKR